MTTSSAVTLALGDEQGVSGIRGETAVTAALGAEQGISGLQPPQNVTLALGEEQGVSGQRPSPPQNIPRVQDIVEPPQKAPQPGQSLAPGLGAQVTATTPEGSLTLTAALEGLTNNSFMQGLQQTIVAALGPAATTLLSMNMGQNPTANHENKSPTTLSDGQVSTTNVQGV